MKKYLKIMLITSSVLLIVGIGCCTGALIKVGFDIEKFSTTVETEMLNQTYDTATVSSVQIDVRQYDDVKILKSSDSNIHVRYCNTTVDSSVSEDGALTISSIASNQPWYRYISFFINENRNNDGITIELPEVFVGRTSINTEAEVTINGIALTNPLTVKTDDKISIKNISVSRLNLSTEYGAIECESCSVTDNIIIDGVDISLSNIVCNLIDCSTKDGGEIKSENVKATDITMLVSNSDISFSNIDTQKLTATCDGSGNISGSLAGTVNDYTIYALAPYGDNCLIGSTPQGARLLHLETEYGDISGITFNGDK